jgi:hypothetical protein
MSSAVQLTNSKTIKNYEAKIIFSRVIINNCFLRIWRGLCHDRSRKTSSNYPNTGSNSPITGANTDNTISTGR